MGKHGQKRSRKKLLIFISACLGIVLVYMAVTNVTRAVGFFRDAQLFHAGEPVDSLGLALHPSIPRHQWLLERMDEAAVGPVYETDDFIIRSALIPNGVYIPHRNLSSLLSCGRSRLNGGRSI